MLLLSIFLLPLIGALVLSVVKVYYKFISLIVTVLIFFLNILVALNFDEYSTGYFMGINIGVDQVSLPFLLLTTFLFVICVIYNCYVNCRTYMALFLLLESFIIGFFVSLDLIYFYIFFEAVLVPMFFIIGIWGGKNRIYAAFKFFLYTLTGSLLFLLGLIYICNTFNESNIQVLTALTPTLDFKVQMLLWIAFFLSFAIKIPMFPFHTWLPDAHVQSPTSGSVILAGILIKMGGYGFLRLSIPMFPDASKYFSGLVMVLSSVSVIYASLVAFSQSDVKKLVAYSSIAHMGVVTAGLFSFNEEGTLGAIFQMISHGLISAALFLCIGMLYTRTGTLEIKKYSGIVNIMPKFSFMFILFSMASIGLPGTSGFIGEFLSMLGIFKSIKVATGFIALGTILSAVYMLNLCKKMIWGISHSDILMKDLNEMELLILTLLAALVIFLGFYPTFVLKL